MEPDRDTLMRMAAFAQVRRLNEVRDHLTARDLNPGFIFAGERIPLINPQRGIFSGEMIHMPARAKDRPDRDRLALRFERFTAAT